MGKENSSAYPVRFYTSCRSDNEWLRLKISEVLRRIFNGHSLFEVAVQEALNNALHFAKAKVSIKINLLCGRRVVVRIQHWGLGFSGNTVLNTIEKDFAIQIENRLMDESGRGLMIMKAGTHCACYNKDGKEVLLAVRLPAY
ncbi:MAG TPA: ATP-binding protein [Methylomusa anaerophila]|uniref:Histidine kinase/HSP90-like ATPase domain-containing protein n=1 Tax=Methylomusa anaerophila TaxID=1930071 RepID=A0A348AJD1_9FIRM|nr:ATP-binding protein [Methylomusa anaerophila]BBB91179.1 hypothetical protein MAMMFC1_01850 [Methylomusa anaerophila]HML89056.1 ATP-binding protein [Methylomusa anaerophila]